MSGKHGRCNGAFLCSLLAAAMVACPMQSAHGQAPAPTVLDPNLAVKTPMGSSISSLATTGAVAGCKIFSAVPPQPAPARRLRMISSADLPDNAHLTGVILRLNDDGTIPTDNPFFAAGATLGGEVGTNVQKVFAYGIRNTFGMAFDPVAGNLWLEENGDDSFSKLSRIEPGQNSGWIQIRGPVERIAEYKAIETDPGTDPCIGSTYFGLQ